MKDTKSYICVNSTVENLVLKNYLNSLLNENNAETKKMIDLVTKFNNNETVTFWEGMHKEYLYTFLGLLGVEIYTKDGNVKKLFVKDDKILCESKEGKPEDKNIDIKNTDFTNGEFYINLTPVNTATFYVNQYSAFKSMEKFDPCKTCQHRHSPESCDCMGK